MSRVQVVTDDQAFAEQVAEALLAKLIHRLPGMLSSAQAESERLMTPSEVRSLKRCRLSRRRFQRAGQCAALAVALGKIETSFRNKR